MNVARIISAIDQEIARLQQARSLIAGTSSHPFETTKRGPGRPRTAELPIPKVKKKHKFTPEGLERLRAAQKKRWAKAKSL